MMEPTPETQCIDEMAPLTQVDFDKTLYYFRNREFRPWDGQLRFNEQNRDSIDADLYVLSTLKRLDCPHKNFECNTIVYHLSDTPDGDITGHAVDVRIQCADCGTPFRFLGLPGGLHPDSPTCSADRLEARLPIEPMK